MSNEEIIEDFIDELREFGLTKETLEVVNALKDILLERKQDKKKNRRIRRSIIKSKR